MAIVDRSGTDWSPWRGSFRGQFIAGSLGIFGVAYGLWWYQRINRNIPRTVNKEWEEATKKLNMAKPREAAGPVMVNPIMRYREQK
mmetsp:Transcript_33989/g.83294  ORF Transcript_33989/g.83294 Transcript_33989/m.83294 type:complete len:86 (+) Transcript_33989:66-323(+)